MTKLIVFDLYNTLIKVNKRSYFFKEVYRKSNFLKHKYSIKDFQNLLITQTIENILERLPNNDLKYYHDHYFKLEDEINSISMFEGIDHLLEELSNHYKIGLISNLATPYKKPFYSLGLLDHFDEAIFSCDVGLQKPNVGIFRLMEEKLGYSGDEVLMVGDSFKSDYQGSISVGWKALRVVKPKKEIRKFEISSISDLEDYLL